MSGALRRLRRRCWGSTEDLTADTLSDVEDGFPLPRWQYAVGMVGGLAIAITVFSALGSNALVLVGLTSVSLNLWWQTRRRRRLLADASS